VHCGSAYCICPLDGHREIGRTKSSLFVIVFHVQLQLQVLISGLFIAVTSSHTTDEVYSVVYTPAAGTVFYTTFLNDYRYVTGVL
jgi:hypothetical protein